MNKKSIFIIMAIVLCIFSFVDRFIKYKYDVNLIQFFRNSGQLTEDEKKWLEEHGTIIYGADQNSPPLRYVDSETRQYKGISVDIINALSIEMGVEIKFKPLIFDEALKSLAEGKTNMCDMFPSAEREKYYLFSDPIYNLRGVILVRDNEAKIKSYRDLKDVKVAVPKGDFAIEYLNVNVSDIKYVYTNDMENAIKLLVKGDASAVVGDEPVIGYFIEKLKVKDSVKILDPPLYEKGVVLGVPKSQTKLLSILNKAIFNMKRKNTVEKIQQKWFGISTPISKEEISQKVMAYLGLMASAFMLIFYFLYYWNKKLQTEVKRQTEELYVSRNDLQTTFDGVAYFMVVVDSQCNIVNVNRAFSDYVKVEKEAIIGKSCSEYKGLLCTDCSRCAIKETFINGGGYKREIKYDNRVFELDAFPLEDKNKNILKVLLAIKDVTTLKMNEKQLLEASKMAAVGQLAAGVAHEIRNPLGLIRNYTYILKKQLNGENEKASRAIEVIESSVDRASSIIDNLLNFSRISGDIKEKANIKEFVKNLMNLENKAMQQKGIKAILECEEDIICSINLEALKHILINLISNSIDAMPGGGSFKIECMKNDRTLCFNVSDTGTGIKKEDMDKIFNPFFTTKAPGKGTGLGLYIVYNQVQKLGGEIQVISEVDKGTTFRINLPLMEGE